MAAQDRMLRRREHLEKLKEKLKGSGLAI